MSRAEKAPRWPLVVTLMAQLWLLAGFAGAAANVQTLWIRIACALAAAFLGYRAGRTLIEIRRRSRAGSGDRRDPLQSRA